MHTLDNVLQLSSAFLPHAQRVVAPAQQAYASAYAERKAATEETIEGEPMHMLSLICVQMRAWTLFRGVAGVVWRQLLRGTAPWTAGRLPMLRWLLCGSPPHRIPLHDLDASHFLIVPVHLHPAGLEHRAEFAAGAALGAAEKAPEAAATTAAGVQAGAQRALTAAEKAAAQAAEAGREAAEVGTLLLHIGWAATLAADQMHCTVFQPMDRLLPHGQPPHRTHTHTMHLT